jgi:hypothetical protein
VRLRKPGFPHRRIRLTRANSHGVGTTYRHLIAVCDLSLIKWDQVQIIVIHPCLRPSTQSSTD